MTARACILPPPPEDDRDTDVDEVVSSYIDCDRCVCGAAWCPDGDGMAVYWSTGPEVE